MRKILPFFLLTVLFLFLPYRPAPEARTTEKDLLRLFDDVLRDVSRIRGLEMKAPISKGIRSKKQIRAMLKESIEKAYASGQMETERLCLIKLGVMPSELKFEKFLVDLEAEQIAGYYDTRNKTFYLADWLPVENQKSVMAHELVHALQHQNYDMSAFLERIEGNDDQAMARLALLEGDAMLVMLDYELEPLGRSMIELPNFKMLLDFFSRLDDPEDEATKADKVFKTAPVFFQESAMFPYISGGAFVQTFRKVKTWKQVDALYKRVPQSTEQVMHLPKYLIEKDAPTPIEAALPAELAESEWTRVHSNVLGEFGLGMVLRQSYDSGEAGRAAKGWDGDRVQLFKSTKGKLALSIRSVWDTPYDANHFYKCYQAVISKKYPDAVREVTNDGVTWKSSGQRAVIRLSGTQVDSLEEDL